METNELILLELREMRAELNSYAKQTAVNTTDITWIRGSAKWGATIIAAVVSGAISFVLKYVAK